MHSHELLPFLPFLATDLFAREKPEAPTSTGDITAPKTFLLRGSELAALRNQIQSGESEVAKLGYGKLLELADQACEVEPMSVCDKAAAPLGGTLNDYFSLPKYAWPNPDTPDGLPYVRIDGRINPEVYDESRFDAARLGRLSSTMFILSLAYYFSGDQKYGKAAAALLRRWFIDRESRQNPAFSYAQIYPGTSSIRGSGIIEARRYLYIIDAEALLEGCLDWPKKDHENFRSWFSQFLNWLRNSQHGQRAKKQKNNIGLWYDVQCAICALSVGEYTLAEEIVKESHKTRVTTQLADDGSQPLELDRARPYDYAVFNLLAMMALSRAGEAVDFDAWWKKTDDGRSFQRALEWTTRIARKDIGQQLDNLAERVRSSEKEVEDALDKQQRAERDSGALRVTLAKEIRRLRSAEKKRRDSEANTKRRLVQATGELEELRSRLEGIYASRSWRITAPLRMLTGMLARIRRRIPTGEAPQDVHSTGVDPTRAIEVAERAVRPLKARLLKLGFHDRASQELRSMAEQLSDEALRYAAAWELAVWYANQYTEPAATECLKLLDQLPLHSDDPIQQRRTAVLRAESLALLHASDEARQVLNDCDSTPLHPDLYLALANTESDEERRIDLINQALALRELGRIELTSGGSLSAYDRLRSVSSSPSPDDSLTQPLVSIIVPAYNAGTMIETTISSLLRQTWQNIEILVVDDCSGDDTADVVMAMAEKDRRVQLIRSERNAGPYVARNIALRMARGIFATCNDSDDWSHCQKIEIQANHLLAHPLIFANTSQQARAFSDLTFHRRGNAGFYIQPNMSSLMFRRHEVVGKIGYWDSVRFAADSEFTRRIKAVFGSDAMVDLPTGPLSFQRQTDDSLTGSETFGYHGFKMGARRVYEEAHDRFHKEARNRLFVDFPLNPRPFVVPEPMRPDREVRKGQARRFDVVIASDFRLPGGTNMSNAEEIRAQRRMGLRTGLVQLSRYDVNPSRDINPRILEQIDGRDVDLLVYGESASCDLLLVRLPWVLEETQKYVPNIDAKDVRVIVNQPPKRDYGPSSDYIYHLEQCAQNLEGYFEKRGVWHPIGPLVREALVTHHQSELENITLSGDDWANIINISEWRRPIRPERHDKIRVCRHSRDQYVKWPDSVDALLGAYPDSEGYEIHVLGGAETPKAVLGGRLPDNWYVTDFGKKEPREFLANFDVFVYYTHPDWVESFGRVIFEAMSVGLPVILPPQYRALFGDAAIYAEPHEVQSRIEQLMSDDEVYEARVTKAFEFVDTRFGYERHAVRLGAILGRDLSGPLRVSMDADSENSLDGSSDTLTNVRNEILAKEIHLYRSQSSLELSSLVAELISDANDAVQRPLISVTAKTSLPPSGDPHDYWHPAPYWWPNPDAPDGLPYIRRDGERVPGTNMYEAGSDAYDRTRVQYLFDDSLILMLAWKFSGERRYAEKAADQLRSFFLEPETRMSPHLRYAQVRLGHNQNLGFSTGIIEMKDLYYYLDAVRMMIESRMLDQHDISAFNDWLMSYLRWLLTSKQGKSECRAKNNHGTYFDLQVAAIAAFLDQRFVLSQCLRRAQTRLQSQFATDGSQPHELSRMTTAHYCCFNFQGWLNLTNLASVWGCDLWSSSNPSSVSLVSGANWLLAHRDKSWPYPQMDPFDSDRFLPLVFGLPEHIRKGIDMPPVREAPYSLKRRFHPHDGIRPYWQLAKIPK